MIHSIIHLYDGEIVPFRRCLMVLTVYLCFATQVSGQFAPAVGFPGTTAMHYDTLAFVSWATGCTIHRGYRDIAVPDSGYASAGDSAAAIGMATTRGIVSLGDGGVAILTFAKPIVNGSGPDFAVFENGFNVGPPGMAFLELAFVEVSTDGVRYVRFPAIDNVQDTTQIWNGSAMDCRQLNNLAGKYIYGYGTPFDLDEIKDSVGIDVNNIRYVKVIDVIGTLNPIYASRDSRGTIINDPYPTNFASSGFDLDAVGVINEQSANGVVDLNSNEVLDLYPNPTSGFVNIKTDEAVNSQLTLTDVSGRIILSKDFHGIIRIDLSDLPVGIYNVKVIDQDHVFSKLIVKE